MNFHSINYIPEEISDIYYAPRKDESIILRKDQLELAESSIDLQNVILQAPCGSGKTIVAKYLAALSMYQDSLKKKDIQHSHIFIVPRTHLIESYSVECSFTHELGTLKFFIPRGQQYGESYRMIRDFKKFINSKEDNKINSSAILTHQGFCMIWDKLNSRERIKMIRNTTFYVDECHHLTDADDTDEATRIGTIIDIILKANEPSCRMRLMTATLYRGDYKPILSTENFLKFETRHILFEDYFKITKIKSFNFNFVLYEDDALNQLISFIKKHIRLKHIIVLPRIGSKGRDKNTHERYIKAIEKIIPAERILDLIDVTQQQKRLIELKENPEKYNVIISCNLFVEGSDWPPASVIHNLSFGDSLLKINQIVGRVMRIYVKKKHVYSYAYIMNYKEEEMSRSVYSDRFNALMVAMVAEDMIKSLKLPDLPRKKYVVENSLPDFIAIALHEYAVKHGIHLISKKEDTTVIKEYINQVAKRLYSETKVIKKKTERVIDVELIHKYFKSEKKLVEYLRAAFIKDARIGRDAPRERIAEVSIEFIREHFDEICEKEMEECATVFGTKTGIVTDTFKYFRKMIEPFKKEIYVVEAKTKRIISGRKKKRHLKPFIPPKVELDKRWVNVKEPNGVTTFARVISIKPLTVRLYPDAAIDNRRIISGKYRYYSEHDCWVLRLDSENDCKKRLDTSSWVSDIKFGKDIRIKKSDITFVHPLKEVVL